ncbi:hypothetical protein KIP88_30765 [Bradyrhizobium sp. SRL28]|uniref:hypothetical protein n=1 Tax=Bradyrhizobium sp. SRL28 TaxID=2836178 RepID=UPI001BDE4650|nr:hypothetical protein [Bradyrhizobium sp. SRL28]MBT1514879.1 hypothetical protein [Bradyrhizobium sp. SRL28]
MGTLKLHLEKRHLGTPIELAVVAKVRQIADATGSMPDDPLEQEVVIPAGMQLSKQVEVPVGTYLIEARLPSGEVFRERRKVSRDDEEVDVTFKAGQSPHEWLSLQRLAGNVPSQDQYEEWLNSMTSRIGEVAAKANLVPSKSIHIDPNAMSTAAKVMRGAHLRLQPALKSIASTAGSLADFFSGGPPAAPVAPAETTLDLRLVECPAQAGESLWDALASLQAWKVFESSARPTSTCDLTIPIDQGPITLWRITQNGAADQGSSGYMPPRSFAVSRRGDGVDAISLPVPWPLTTTFPAVPLEVLREAGAGPASRTTLTVCDPQVGGLLLYLNNARIAGASAVLDAAQRDGLVKNLISEKLSNPLAACAAAYVGLATFSGKDAPHWGPWLQNLSDWFPWLPDGAVVSAAYRVKTARTTQDLDAASEAFVSAFRRGIPYYTAGVQQLLQGLYLFRSKSTEIDAMYGKVSNIALRSDAGQTFTVVTVNR